MIALSELREALDSGECVSLITDQRDDSTAYGGFIIGLSDHFVMMQCVEDWHHDGIQIFPLTRLSRIEYAELGASRTAILNFNGVVKRNDYDWVNLASFVELLWSVKSNGKTVFMSDNDEAEVGDIVDVRKTHVTLKAIDAAGERVDEPVEFYYSNITYVQFDDEYTTVLRRYADRRTLQ